MRTAVVTLVFVVLLGAVPMAAAAEDAATLKARGDAAFQKQDWGTAAQAYQPLTQLAPADAGVWYRLGDALHALGRLDEAIVVHQKAATFPQLAPRALYNLACAQALKGEQDAALDTLEKAIRLGFRSPTLLREDADLTSLIAVEAFLKLEQRALPPARRAVYRQFDFWVGTWDVTTAGGQKSGRNVITRDEGGMLLTEHWTNTQGATGTSINFYDTADNHWHQVWVDPSGTVSRYVGSLEQGEMRFEGTSTDADGKVELRTMVFTPRPDGSVRQFIRTSRDAGATWIVYFDGIYVRVPN